MDQRSLVIDQIDAGADLVKRFDKHTSVKVAFWLNPTEDGQWQLYIASEEINDTNFDLGYGEVLRLTQEMQNPNIDPFQVKLIGAEDPLARDVLEIQQRFPAKIPTHYNGPTLGGVSIEAAYFYAMPIAAPST